MQTLRDTFASLSEPQRWWLGGGLGAVVVVFVVILLVTGGDDPLDAPTTTTAPSAPTSSSAASTSTTTSTTEPTTTTRTNAAAGWPLTGTAAEEGSTDSPILAVKIDNTIAARPQAGLEMADLVIDIPVEGGISRLLAFFQSGIPTEIGPVRSVREVDSKLLAPFGALLAYSGGNAPVVAAVLEVAADLGHPALGALAYRRAPDRAAPYDLMFDPQAGLATVDQPASLAGPWLSFGEGPTGESARTVEIVSSASHQVSYGFSASDGGYLRFHGSQPHESSSGDQLVATNVVVLVVDQLETGRTDSGGAPVPDFEVLGSGEAVVFRDGMVFPGRWERGRVIDFFRFFDDSGFEINLASGTTWVHLVPEGRTFDWR